MVYRSTCKDAEPSKQPLEYGIQVFLKPAMSDLEEGEIEDGELPSTEPEAPPTERTYPRSSLRDDGHTSTHPPEGIPPEHKRSKSVETSPNAQQPARLSVAPSPISLHQRSQSHHKESSPGAGEVEDGEIAQQPAAPAVTADKVVSAPVAAKKKVAAKAAPTAKTPLQFKMPDLQSTKAQQHSDQQALQQAPLLAFADIALPEQNEISASDVPVPSESMALTAAQEVAAPHPSLHHSVHNSQHSQPAGESSDARRSTQHNSDPSKHAERHERVQPNGRMQRGVAESAPHISARSRSRGASSHKQRIDSPPRYSSAKREPNARMPEQSRGSAAQRAKHEMAPMVSDIEKLLSSVSLQTIRKDLEAAANTLKQALSQAYGLYKLCRQKDKGSGAVVKAIFGQLSPKLLASINALYVYACTGQGKAAMKDHATARTCIRLAVRDKDFLFTAADSTKFSSMIVMSEVFRGYDKTLSAQQDVSQLSSSAGQSVPPPQQPSQGQVPGQERSMPHASAPGTLPQPLPGPPPIHSAPPPPVHGAGTGPPSLPSPLHMLGGAMPAHPMMQHLPPHMQESKPLSHLQHAHGRPGMPGSQRHSMHEVPGQNGLSGHRGHGPVDSQDAHVHAHKRQRGDQHEDRPYMHQPLGDIPRFPSHIQRRHAPALPPPPHAQQPSHDPAQHAHPRPAGPPQLPPHLALHASLQHPQSGSASAAGYGDAQQPAAGHLFLPPHLAASMSSQQQHQEEGQLFGEPQQQPRVRSAAAEAPEQVCLQPDTSSSAPQPKGKRQHSRRHKARERKQRERQLLDGGGTPEQVHPQWQHQHDSASAPDSVPGLIEEQQLRPPPVPLSEQLHAGEPTVMEIEELSDSEGLYGDAAGSPGGGISHVAAVLHAEATAKGSAVIHESLQRTERVAKVPSMSEEDYVEAGAQELQQLYADMAPDMCRLLSQQRLVLVLDLDHTLVNSARQIEIDPEHVQLLEEKLQEEVIWPEQERSLFKLDGIAMWTKLRPGVRAMLAQLAPLFQLWIFTNGTRPYAEAIANLLDPQGGLFHRVIANSASTDKDGMAVDQLKSFSRGLAAMDAAVVVVDDNDHVWQNHRHNLLRVERYMYFPIAMRHFGRSDKSLLERGKDESPKEGMLKHTLDALLRTHITAFEALWEQPERLPNGLWRWDVRHCMWVERQKVLAGVTVLFSALVPLGQDPRAHSLGQLAEQFGAKCVTQEVASVSHVVAANSGSAKAQWAIAHGKHLVSRHWLESSCTLWKRAQELRFPAPAAHAASQAKA